MNTKRDNDNLTRIYTEKLLNEYNTAAVRSPEEVEQILELLRAEHTAETIDELIHYGGLRELLLYGEGDGPLSVEDAMHQAHMNS